MDEYISKQKVLDYLNGYLHSLGEGGADDLLFDRGQRRALINTIQDISAVKAADVQPVNQWISVDDKLPDTVDDCLVWYSCDTAFGKSKSVGISFCSRYDWYKKHLNGDNIVVLYWMPLPEPPKDGDAK